MNENQKERLLKIAEANPELAKEMMDFMKEERQSSQDPVAVKVVKAEEDKLTITDAQKEWVMLYIFSLVAFFINLIVTPMFFMKSNYFPISFVVGLLLILCGWYCAYKAGMPAIKQIASKYIKFET